MKKWTLIIVVVVLFAVGLPVQSDAAIKPLIVALDGTTLTFGSAKPFLDKQKRVLVPVRFVSEKLGTDVKWTKETKTVAVSAEGLDITLVLGATKATVNGVSKDLGTQAVEKGGSVFVPLRFVSEALGRTVVWDSANQIAHIWNLVDESKLTVEGWDEKHDYIGFHHFDVKDGELTFEDALYSGPGGAFKGRKLVEKFYPGLSAKTYNMIHYLTDEKGYTEARYYPSFSGIPSNLLIAYGPSEIATVNSNYYFGYSFREDQYYESFASKKVTTIIRVERFNWNKPGNDPYVVNKFRMSLVALYGDIYGIQIHNWIMDLWNKNTTAKEFITEHITKKIGDYQFDFEGADSNVLSLLVTKKG